MNWQAAIGIASSLSLLVPVVIIIALGLIFYRNYLALFIYCLLAFIYNLMTEDILVVSKGFQTTWGLVNNLLDVPLMLLFLQLFSKSKAQKKRIKIYLAVFICFEIVVLALYGLNIQSITIVMGPGLTLILVVSFVLFVQKLKICLVNKKALGKTFLTAAIFFAYGCFGFIYLMHYIMKLPDVADIFLIYYLSTIVYCTLLAIGLLLESKRIKKIEEIQVTRKELGEFFGYDGEQKQLKKTSDAKWKLKSGF